MSSFATPPPSPYPPFPRLHMWSSASGPCRPELAFYVAKRRMCFPHAFPHHPSACLCSLAYRASFGRRELPFVTVVTDLGGAHPTWFNSEADKVFIASDAVMRVAFREGLATAPVGAGVGGGSGDARQTVLVSCMCVCRALCVMHACVMHMCVLHVSRTYNACLVLASLRACLCFCARYYWRHPPAPRHVRKRADLTYSSCRSGSFVLVLFSPPSDALDGGVPSTAARSPKLTRNEMFPAAAT